MKEKIKPVVGVEKEERLDKVFYRQFSIHYKALERDDISDSERFSSRVLSGLFLCLTLESYITWVIRQLLIWVNRKKNGRFLKVWHNHFETSANLNKKVQFFADVFLDEKSNSEIRKIQEFINELKPLRNKVVHGHRYSETFWSNGRVDETGLVQLLTFEEIDDNYEKFQICMKLIQDLIRKIDMEELMAGISSKEYIVKSLTFEFIE